MLTRMNGRLAKVEYGKAVILLEDGQEFKVRKDDLQPLPALKTEMVVQVMTEAEAALSQQALAKTLLNQLLHDEAEAS